MHAYLDTPISLLIEMPVNMPSISITEVWASPLAVMSPMLSAFLEKDLYIAFLVDDEVNMAICLSALAIAAENKNKEGIKYVKISKAFPGKIKI